MYLPGLPAAPGIPGDTPGLPGDAPGRPDGAEFPFWPPSPAPHLGGQTVVFTLNRSLMKFPIGIFKHIPNFKGSKKID